MGFIHPFSKVLGAAGTALQSMPQPTHPLNTLLSMGRIPGGLGEGSGQTNIQGSHPLLQGLLSNPGLLNAILHAIHPPLPPPISGPHPQPGTQEYSDMHYGIGMKPGAGQF